MVTNEPTKRFVIEPSLICNIKCRFCYHLHKYDQWHSTIKHIDTCKAIIDAGVARGNTAMDITGGEPSIYPEIVELIKYAKSKGLAVCMITNGLMPERKSAELLKAGLDEFLVSRHGLINTHNEITKSGVAYTMQNEFLEHVHGKCSLRFNCVISQYNQTQLLSVAREIAKFDPVAVNFINMNPHHEWMQKDIDTADVIANLNIVQPILEQAIDYLTGEDIDVNIRYYPHCYLSEQYRKHIVNDLQVVFDPYEWDYSITPKTEAAFTAWAVACSDRTEEKGEPCNKCKIHGVCGGINKHFHRVANNLSKKEICRPLE